MSNIRIIIVLAFLLNAFIKSDLYSTCETGTPSDKNDCFDRISEDEKEREWHCCYATQTPKTTSSTTTTSHRCDLLGEDEYNDINGYIQDEQANKDFTLNVECNQTYISLNLLLLILLFCF